MKKNVVKAYLIKKKHIKHQAFVNKQTKYEEKEKKSFECVIRSEIVAQ